MTETIIIGRVLTSKTPQSTRLENVALLVDTDGTIQERTLQGTARYDALSGRKDAVWLPDDALLIPGLTDLHIHAPQWPQAGMALDRPLEDWLGTYTFPLEASYADPAFAEDVYDDLVRTLLENGTTTALYFATIHEEASLVLARTCLRYGQRGFVGLVAMDHPDLAPRITGRPALGRLWMQRVGSLGLFALFRVTNMASFSLSSPRGSSPPVPMHFWKGLAH